MVESLDIFYINMALLRTFRNRIQSNKSFSFLCKCKTIFLSAEMSNTNKSKYFRKKSFINFNDSNYIITHLKNPILHSINLCVYSFFFCRNIFLPLGCIEICWLYYYVNFIIYYACNVTCASVRTLELFKFVKNTRVSLVAFGFLILHCCA